MPLLLYLSTALSHYHPTLYLDALRPLPPPRPGPVAPDGIRPLQSPSRPLRPSDLDRSGLPCRPPSSSPSSSRPPRPSRPPSGSGGLVLDTRAPRRPARAPAAGPGASSPRPPAVRAACGGRDARCRPVPPPRRGGTAVRRRAGRSSAGTPADRWRYHHFYRGMLMSLSEFVGDTSACKPAPCCRDCSLRATVATPAAVPFLLPVAAGRPSGGEPAVPPPGRRPTVGVTTTFIEEC